MNLTLNTNDDSIDIWYIGIDQLIAGPTLKVGGYGKVHSFALDSMLFTTITKIVYLSEPVQYLKLVFNV